MAVSGTQHKAIVLSLQNVSQVIAGINQMTAAWSQHSNRVTKNQKDMIALFNQQIDTMAAVAIGAMRMGNNTSQSLTGMEKGIVAFGISASHAINHLAGGFSWLSSVIGGLGGLIGGTLIGGPAGGLMGTAIGQIGGSLIGAFLNVPLAIVKTVGGAVKDILDSVIGSIKGVGQALNNLIFGPVSLFGLVLGQGFRTMGEGLSYTIKSVWEATEAFQQLIISIETLTAREIARAEGLEVSMVATDLLREKTENLFNWLSKVSLTSPFTMKSIADAMKFASAMGLPIGAVQQLTLATGNFSAAMGLTEDHQYRIMYNLAQIYQQGKLTGREFRDLAISFVPVYDILGEMAKEAGMTTNEFKKLALEGGVPVEDFFKRFIDYMSKNYPDAMKRMSRTMIGVRNNFKDFIQVVMGMEFLGPTMDKISGRLADIMDKILSPETHRLAKDFGIGLARAFDIVAIGVNEVGRAIKNMMTVLGFAKPTVNDLANLFVKLFLNARYALGFIASVINTIATGIKNYVLPALASLGLVSKKGEGWGLNLMYNFAKGIIVGVAKYLAMAIVYVTTFIKRIFGPGSPPMVAPHIDKWGADMMNEWVGGMIEKTNWKRLGEVTDIIKGTMMGTQHDWDEGGSAPPGRSEQYAPTPPLPRGGGIIYEPGVGIFPPIAKSIKKGVQNAISQVTTFVTEAGMRLAAALMSGFNEAMFDALDNTQSVIKSAISALTDIGLIDKLKGPEMFYDFSMDMIAALDQFNKTGEISAHLIDEISRLGMALGPELAKLVIKQFDLVRAINDAEAAQERLNRAIESVKNAHKSVKLLVSDYNKLLRAGTNKAILKTKLKEVNASESAYIAAEKEKIAAEENKKIADERVDQMKKLVSLQEKLVNNMIELLQAQSDANSAAGGMEDSFENMASSLSGMAEDITKSLDPILNWEKYIKENAPGIKSIWETAGELFATTFSETLANADLGIAADNFVKKFKKSIAEIFGMEELAPVYSPKMREPDKRNFVAPKQPSFFQQFMDNLFSGTFDWSKTVSKLSYVITDIVLNVLSNIYNDVITPGTKLNNALFGLGGKMAWAIFSGIMRSIFSVENMRALSDLFMNFSPTNLPEIAGNILSKIFGGDSDVIEKKDKTYIDLNFAMPSEDTVLATKIKEWATQLKNAINTAFGAPSLGGAAVQLIPTGESIVNGITKGVDIRALIVSGTGGALFNTIGQMIKDIRKLFKVDGETASTNPFINLGETIMNSIKRGIDNMKQALRDAIDALGFEMPAWLAKLLESGSPSKVFMRQGEDIVLGLVKGIDDKAEALKRTVRNTIKATADMAYNTDKNMVSEHRATSKSRIVSAPAVTRITNVTFGDVHLENGMDWAVFKANVNKVIVEG